MPDTIANNGTAVPDMSRAAAKAIYPNGGRNRTAARVQAALLRGLVGLAAALTAAVLLFLIGYILVNGIPNLKPSLFAWEYNSENVSLMPALINTLLMTAFSLVIATPLGIFAAIWLVEYAHRGSKLVRLVRLTTETLQGIPSIVYGLFGMLFFVTRLHWGYSLLAGAMTLAIMILPLIMLSGMVFPIENMPGVLQGISCIVPARWYIEAVRKLMVEGLPFAAVLKEFAVLAVMTGALIGVALGKFNDKLE